MGSHGLTLLLAVGCLLAAALAQDRFKRLTTFGKAPEKQNHPGKLKDCRVDKDCPVQGSSCKEDTDGKKRCICDDGLYPVNSYCQHSREKRGYVPKGNGQTKEKGPDEYLGKERGQKIAIALREPCTSSTDCIHGAECKINPNATTPSMMKTKVCLCREEYIEEDNECSGCVRLEKNGWVLFILGLTSLMAFHH